MNKKSKTENQQLTLREIENLIEQLEERRRDHNLSREERETVEESIILLRHAERQAISDIQKGIITSFEEGSEEIRLQAAKIRDMVTKLGRIPKALDTLDRVAKEAIRVLNLIAKIIGIYIVVLLFASCASLSKTQIKRINSLAFASDSISTTPATIFESLDEINHERSLIYVASLTGVENRIQELNNISKYENRPGNIAESSLTYCRILNSYIKAIQSLSNEQRWRRSGVELRAIGRKSDSLIIAYNQLGIGNPIEFTMSKQIGRTSGYLSEQYYKRRQYRLLKDILIVGDTIVRRCCESLIQTLKSDNLIWLIENEERGVESDFRSYLYAMQVRDETPNSEYDRLYLELKEKIHNTKRAKTRSINALHAFSRAHSKLVQEIQKGGDLRSIEEDIIELSEQYLAIKRALN